MQIKIGLGSCGIASGAKKVAEAIQAGLQERQLPIKLERTGCIGMCFAEPPVSYTHLEVYKRQVLLL